jgi:hypothetical protein
VKVRKPPDGSIESVRMQLIDSILAVPNWWNMVEAIKLRPTTLLAKMTAK